MSGEDRRKEIVAIIREETEPVSGAALAGRLKVSRQVIVQDIALLRAAGYGILSMTRGYILKQDLKEAKASRVLKVRHTDEQTEEEMQTAVDYGGVIKDVFVHHKVYGTVRAEMNIRSRKEIRDFLEDIRSGKSSPLKNITSDYHYHTVTADSEETLDLIEKEWDEKGFLIRKK